MARHSANKLDLQPSELCQSQPAKPTTASKHHHHANPPKRHQNGNNKPSLTEARRPMNKLPLGPCQPLSENDRLTAALKLLVLGEFQKPRPDAPQAGSSRARDSLICNPIMSEKRNSQAVAIPSQSNQNIVDNTLSSTPTQRTVAGNRTNVRPEQPTRTPEVVSCTPTNGSTLINPSQKPNASPSHPPGLSRQRGRGGMRHSRSRGSAKSVAGDSRHNQAVGECERHIGPETATPNVVKLPHKDTPQAPRSPSTTASSLSEDTSGWSSVPVSDTTFTSVGSQFSNMASSHQSISREICKNWSKGFPCAWKPCRYLHFNPGELQKPRPDLPQAEIHSIAPNRDPLTHEVKPLQNAEVLYQHSQRRHHQNGNHKRSDTEARTQNHQQQFPNQPRIPPGLCPRPPENEVMVHNHDPPNRNPEPQKPALLYSTTISDHIKVRFDQGFEVRDVMTGFESRWVHFGNVSTTVTSVDMDELLRPYKVDSVNLPESSGKSITVKVQFVSTEDAVKAVTDLNGIEFAKRTITAKLSINNSSRGSTVLIDTDVQLVWDAPSRAGYAGYETLEDAKAALKSLNGTQLDYLVMTAQLYEGLPCVHAYNVMLEPIPANVTIQHLRKFTNAKDVMVGPPNYDSLDKAIKSIRSRLEDYGTLTSFNVLPAPYKDGKVKAWARFTSPAEARAAQDDLDRRRPKIIGHTTLSCRHVVSVSHVLSVAMYKIMRGDIGLLRLSWQDRYGQCVSVREKSRENDETGPIHIKLSSERPELLSILKYEYEQLLHGETVTLEKKPLWDDFLIAPAGRAYIEEMHAQYPGVQIEVRLNSRTILLWGPMVMRHRARQEIVRKVVELKAQQLWKIPLSGKLLGIFHSTEFSTLQGLLGSDNCILDFGARVLVVRGNDSAFRTACDVVQDLQSRQGDVANPSRNVCPVCFGEAVVPMSLTCGHRWCRSCLTSYLTSAVENRMFPLKCLGNDATCTQCIPLGISRRLLSAADFNAVIEAAFWSYVHSRPDEFHHCPTPDCPQVYRSAPQNAVLQCPSCLTRICPACRIEYHDGMTCEERDVAEDKLFGDWTSNHDVKNCPGCKAPIERSEGCNHVTCTRCQTHICWECLQTFPKGQGIYDHMRYQHGSIGL